MTRLRLRPPVLLALGLALCIGAGPLPGRPGKKRGVSVDEPAPQALGSRRALIVGINYEGDEQAKKARIDELRSAENDARAVQRALIDYFGYEEKDVVLLTGKRATLAEIEKGLKALGDPTRGKPEDSILFFFAGHGLRRANSPSLEDGYMGELIPYGAEYDEKSDRPAWGAVLPLKDVKRRLGESKARHKLMVLDCCHAGEVFNLPIRPARANPKADAERLRQQPCFWGAASCRARESATDSKSGSANSPFTDCVLRMLQDLSGADGKQPVSARELFESVQRYFESEGNTTQRPISGPLSREAGMFYFYPRLRAGKAWDTRTPEKIGRTLPGAQGDWWFDEMPWLMPSLRATIVASVRERSASMSSYDKMLLERAADAVIRKAEEGTPSPRHQHLKALRRLSEARDVNGVLKKIADELGTMEGKTAEDLHLRALVLYQLERDGAAKEATASTECFREALAAYKKKGKDGDGAMYALCHADLGHVQLRRGDFDGAAKSFWRARRALPPSAMPRHFEVYTYCKGAEAHRGVGNWHAADHSLGLALIAARKQEPGGALEAVANEGRAWAFLAQWRVGEAEACFRAASNIRELLIRNDPKDHDSRLLKFHSQHGLALALRLRGRREEAIKKYEALVRDVRAEIARFERGADSYTNPRNFRTCRARLYHRLAVSQERLGDCLLYGEKADPAEARRFYRKAHDVRHEMPDDQSEAEQIKYRFKMAVAAAQSSGEEATLGKRLLALAERDLKAAEESKRVRPEQASALAVLRAVSTGLVGLRCPPGEKGAEKGACPREQLYEYVKGQLNDRSRRARLQRDEMELMVLAAQALLKDARATPARGEGLTRPLVLLRGLCKLVQAQSGKDALAYLRPLYDQLLTARLEASPKDVKSMLDLVSAARTGREMDEVVTKPTLVFYFTAEGRGYALLDVPGGASKAYPIHDDFQHARRTRRALALPRELQDRLGRFREVAAYWNDELYGLDGRSAFLFAPEDKPGGRSVLVHSDPPDEAAEGVTLLKPGEAKP